MADRRIVVTGIGVASPFGLGREAFASGLLEGRSGVGPITQFDASTFPIRVAAEVAGYSDELLPNDPRYHRILSRAMKLGLVAAAGALADAGLDDPDVRAGVACLASVGRQDVTVAEFGPAAVKGIDPPSEATGNQFALNRERYLSRSVRAMHPLWLLTFIPNLAVAHIGMTFGLRGEANTYTAEGAAALQAVGDAAASIREGLYDVALVGGCDSRVGPIPMARFLANGHLARATDAGASRPFDRRREGYVLGEGAVYLVVEAADHAERRGARPLAEVLGWGGGSDAYDPRRAHPEGRGLVHAMRGALATAGSRPEAVDLVVATAASMPDLDAAESAALGAVFGAHEPAVTAPAGAIGRTHAAIGAFNAAAAIISLASQAVPATLNTTEPDEGAPAGLVLGREARSARLATALANGYAIGGQSASVLFGEVRS
jgi:3-oxoacyl-[acyl-carrier-protein] synthase II